VPQIENSVRHYFQVNGILTTTLHPNGLEDVKLWGDNGGLLGMPEFEELFGQELKFELRGHLVEKTAFNFRNRLSHGMVSEGECYSIQRISTWWLALRLCFPPYVSPNQ